MAAKAASTAAQAKAMASGQFTAGGEEKMNLWFAGFCPADDPQYTVVVMQDGQTAPAYASAAVFGRVCEALWLLADVAHVHYLLSAALAFLMGLTVNYLLSTCWVFDKSRISNVWAEFAVFALIGVVGLGLNELIIYLCTGVWGMWVMLSKIISTGIVFFWNFFARKYILFRSGKE